jgi:hypothetical protein
MWFVELTTAVKLSEMAKAAANSVPVEGASAPTLTESYMRIRTAVLNVLEGDEDEEFRRLLPEIAIVEAPSPGDHMRMVAKKTMAAEPSAREAKNLLDQMAGWLSGIVDIALLDRRIQAEAEANARTAQKPRTGFGAT